MSASPWTSSVFRGRKKNAGPGPRARGGLARGLLLVLLPLILGPLITFAVLIYRQVQSDTSNQAFAQLQSLAEVKKDQIAEWAAGHVANIANLANASDFQGQVRDYYAGRSDGSPVANRLNDFLVHNSQFEAVMLARPSDGLVSQSTRQSRFDRFIGTTFLDSSQLNHATSAAFMAPPSYDARVQDVVLIVAAPVVDPASGSAAGIVLGFVRGSQLSDVVAPVPGLGRTGRAFVMTHDGFQVGSMVTGAAANSAGIDRARMNHLDGNDVYLDQNGQQVFGVYRWLPNDQLALLVEESTAEALAPLNRFAVVLLVISLGAIAVSLLGVVFFTRRVTGPLQALTEGALRMAGGDLTARVSVDRQDEVGLLAEAFNSMSAELRGLYQDLERKVEARTQQLATAAEVGRAATSILSTEDLLRRSVDLIRDRFAYYHVSVFLLDEGGGWAVLTESTGEVGAQLKARGYRLAVGSNSLVGWVTANKQPRIVLDVAADELYLQNELLADTRSECALPLRVGDRLIGALDVQSRSLNAFNQADIEVLQVLADQLAVAAENGRLFAETQQRLTELAAINNISQALATQFDFNALLKLVGDQVFSIFGVRDGFVALYDSRTNLMEFPYFMEAGQPQSVSPRPLGGGLTSAVISTRQPLLINSDTARRTEELGAFLQGAPSQSWLGVPIPSGDDVIGVLSVQDTEREGRFGQADIGLLSTIAANVGVALQNARLFQETRRRAEQLATAADVARATTASLDRDELLRTAVNLIRERFGFYHASVFTVEPGAGMAVLRESTGEAGLQLKARHHQLAVGSRSLVGSATASRQPVVVQDVINDPTHLKNPLLPDTRAEAVIPLLSGDEVVGALDVQSTQPHAFGVEDIAILVTMADQLAVALQNARLFDQTRGFLNRQTLLYEVTRAAASATNLGDALDGAVNALGQVLPGAAVAILLLDAGGQTLHLRAAAGFPSGYGGHLTVPVGAGIAGWVAAQNQAALIPDVRQDPRYMAGAGDVVSEAAVPLALGDRVIGVLDVKSPQAGAFGDSDLQLLSTLAGTLTAVIVNNNLLEEITRERERLSVLYDVLQSLIMRPDRQAIYRTALDMAPRLGAQYAYLLLIGQREADAAFLSTLPGLDQLDGRQSNAYALTIASQGLERWVLENGRPAIVPDTRADERWYMAPEHVQSAPARAVISVPLQTQRGSLRGVLAYTHSLPGALGDEHLPLIESIARQVAVALENEQLRQQQRAQSENAQALARAAQAMTRTLNEAELHQIIVGQIFAAFEADGVIMLRWVRANNTFLPLAVQVAERESVDDLRSWPALGQGFSATKRLDLLDSVENGRGRIVPLREEPDGRLRQSMALPLLYGGDVEGIVEVVRTDPIGGLGQVDLELLQSILTAAASALQTARLYELQRQTAERLAEVDRLKSQFLANMSHELRTPLNSIIGFSRVILKGIDGPMTDLQSQDLTSINNAGQHLLGLINDILDMARIEAGKMELVLDEVDLHDTISGVMSTASALIKDKTVHLVQDVPDDLPRVRADSMRVRQVLLNLLSNAAKFTDYGAITLRARQVEAAGPNSGRLEPCVEISVIDTGTGIAPEDMSKLFEPFSQVDASATRKVGGTGLGLSICRQLVDLHSGRIWAESEFGRGSTFTFILPVGQPEAARPYPADAPLDPADRIVLAVDDDPGLVGLYRRYLEPHGYRVVGVNRSSEALARAAELRPIAVLLDVLMPNKDGWQVLTDLKRSELTRAIPVIMCTLITEPERALEMGAADYLTKPILEADLLGALRRLPAPDTVIERGVLQPAPEGQAE